jgi:glycosyltransferase involved in cell wall biosynthesis
MELDSQHSPRVSILLPTHNRADVLPFALRSVLAQTVQDFELLIVGDGCTDNTAEIVQSFNDPRIHWFDLPKGPTFGYANRNIGLQKARGEYIAYMTHDDLWLCDHLEQLLKLFDDDTIEIAFSRPLWVIPPGMIVPGIYNLNHAPTLNIFLNIRNGIPSDCTIHRRDCFSRYGYWDDTLCMSADWDMWKRIIKGGGERNFS